MANDFTIEGYAEQEKKLRQMMSEDPDFRKRVHAALRKILAEVRKKVSQATSKQVPDDPRQAYRAVRSAVYKRILGGQVNILDKRKAGSPTNYQKPRKGLPNRGGNRWGRSERTKQLEGYDGPDRGFILRFLNDGVHNRQINSYTDRNGNSHSLRSGDGDRDGFDGRGWFGPTSQAEMEKASGELQQLIDDIINKIFV